ncbi:MAG: BatD family protein [Endozoicomonas sp. (ex Botrylloides leachii)]|nr:BatD family protein [Endozoicomonas sp. (ex Botrylloides leachii)]
MIQSIMTFRRLAQVLIGWLFLLAMPVYATLTASVDKTDIAAYETVTLTLRLDDNNSGTPELNQLYNEFDILSTNKSRQVQIINGHTQSWHDWVITLSPKKVGSLVIPAIQIGNEKSAPITITVTKNKSKTSSSAAGRISPVFIREEVDNKNVYIQQPIHLTLKIFHSVAPLENSRLSPLEINDAIVNQLGDIKKYETVIDGIRYGVFELQFVIYPQKAGTLIIPSLSFTGMIPSRRDPFGSFFAMDGKPIVARSQKIITHVEAPPANYPGNTWLPAKRLTLHQMWSQPIDSIKVGDAVTRTITMEAEGLNAAQLPSLDIPSPDGINTYPDKSSTHDVETAKGIVGKRISAIAMVPTKAGIFRLPPVKITWFDTLQKKTRVAEIPETTIDVQPATHSAVEQPVNPALASDLNKEQTSATASSNTLLLEQADLWKWVAVSMLGLWLLTALVLLVIWNKRRKRLNAASPRSQDTNTKAHKPNEASAFQTLQDACIKGDKPEILQLYLKQWVQIFLKNPNLGTIQQCAKALESEPLQILCEEIDASIYSGNNNEMAGNELLSVCSVIRKTYKPKVEKELLASLYPE